MKLGIYLLPLRLLAGFLLQQLLLCAGDRLPLILAAGLRTWVLLSRIFTKSDPKRFRIQI